MSAALTQDEAQLELAELEMEEHRIMRELREMDERVNSAALARHQRSDGDPRATLNALLAECEQEVRDAKGYISSPGPPLRIARCRRGEGVPPHATYLSRPKGTGVDFTVPVTLKEYNATVKHPIFLNTIRDKCAAQKYSSADDYIADMKLLARNTAAFNKGPELAWVVQHSRLLLECAEEAVSRRRRQINEAVAGMSGGGGVSGGGGGRSRSYAGKRKRSGGDANGSSVAPAVGTTIQVYWENDRRWHNGVIKKKGTGNQVEISYEDDGETEWLDLQHNVKWRIQQHRSKRIAENASKRKKSGASSSIPANTRNTVSVNPDAATKAELSALRDELLGAIEESRNAIVNTLEARYVAVDNKLNRSDALHRVLIAVGDLQQVMEERVDGVEQHIRALQSAVGDLAKHVNVKRNEAANTSAEEPHAETRPLNDSEQPRESRERQDEEPKSASPESPEREADNAKQLPEAEPKNDDVSTDGKKDTGDNPENLDNSARPPEKTSAVSSENLVQTTISTGSSDANGPKLSNEPNNIANKVPTEEEQTVNGGEKSKPADEKADEDVETEVVEVEMEDVENDEMVKENGAKPSPDMKNSESVGKPKKSEPINVEGGEITLKEKPVLKRSKSSESMSSSSSSGSSSSGDSDSDSDGEDEDKRGSKKNTERDSSDSEMEIDKNVSPRKVMESASGEAPIAGEAK